MPTPDDVRRLAVQIANDNMSPDQRQAFLSGVLADRSTTFLESAFRVPQPVVGEVPEQVRGYRVRLDLMDAEPPVWRRLEVPGDITLDRLHEVIQAAMGWLNSHLHRFRTGHDRRSPYFLTPFDLEEGEDGVLEDGVRLDQVLATLGDRLWYEYDFGDGWEHKLAVEAVLDEPPAEVRCTAGRLACPPEDCGGIWGYLELAAWVRGGCDPASVPSPFENADDARDWLPIDWHPDRFDIGEANVALTSMLAVPVPVFGELADLSDRLERRGNRTLREVLARPDSHGTTEVSEAEALRLIEPFVVVLDLIGDGVQLTGAGYLPPVVVQRVAERTGIRTWWLGVANREDRMWPVAQLRDSTRALGLVSVRKGRLGPTAVARRCRDRPLALWRHIVSRLPLGKADFDRQAGWLALAVAGSGTPVEEWESEIRTLLVGLGWHVEDSPAPDIFPVDCPTLDVLTLLAGQTHCRRLTGHAHAVAATARRVISDQVSKQT